MLKDLFSDYDIRTVIGGFEKQISDEILKYNSDYLCNTKETELVDYFIKKYTIYPIGLDTKNISVEQSEVDIDVSQDRDRIILDRSRPLYLKGNRIKYFIPYSGDKNLFFYKPNTYYLSLLSGIVNDKEVIFYIDTFEYDEEKIKHLFDQKLANLFERISWVNSDATTFSNSIKEKVQIQIASRKEKLNKDKELSSKLGFPLRKREDSSQIYNNPLIKKKIIPKLPQVKQNKSIPDPFLENTFYDEILKTIENMSFTMEKSPRTFAKLSEEEIRDHFLMVLNSQYEGNATGETFNYEGKTDILIRDKGKNIFIAECKIWKGEKTLLDTISQLLKYVSWRDTKTAILFFNKNKGLTSVLKKIDSTVLNHPNYKRKLDYNSETGFRYIINHKDDNERELYLTILIFDIPSE